MTVEGEQVILSLQLARFLLKAVDEAAANGKDKVGDVMDLFLAIHW